jgi:hypothetical protein
MENELDFIIEFSVTVAVIVTVMLQVAYNSSNQAQLGEKDQFSFAELIVSTLAPCM